MTSANRTMTDVSLATTALPAFPRFHLIAMGGVAATCLFVYVLSLVSLTVPTGTTEQESPSVLHFPLVPSSVSAEPAKSEVSGSSYEIQRGDTLGGIFAEHGFNHAALNAVLAADAELLALDILRPGNMLHFEYSESSGELLSMSLAVHPGKTIHYRQTVDGIFEFEEDIKPTYWREEVVSTPIYGSFYTSASRAGVSDSDIIRAQRIFEERVNFRRDIRAGDRFEIVFGREMTNSDATGQTRIEAIRLHLRHRIYSAFLHDDGNYYDEQGESLSRAFLRYPMRGNYRVSSHFNLRRLHPVTRRIAPHHGVDFAMPVGTPILSIGDGVVTRVGNHPYAGKYIEIRHAGQFKTRYLHLSRILVRQGQQVTRSDRIALSGNTGRSTGPHLHFELHINERPVDPLTADIPTASNVPAEEMAVFTQRVKMLAATMESETLLALEGEQIEAGV